jgi:hypothetical protein
MADNLGFESIGAKNFSWMQRPETEEFWDTLFDSKAVKKLQSDRDKTGDKYFDYALDRKEIFARGFSQYIAEKTQDEGLMWELNNKLEFDFYQDHWTHSDFKPILKAFDKLFEMAGMLR